MMTLPLTSCLPPLTRMPTSASLMMFPTTCELPPRASIATSVVFAIVLLAIVEPGFDSIRRTVGKADHVVVVTWGSAGPVAVPDSMNGNRGAASYDLLNKPSTRAIPRHGDNFDRLNRAVLAAMPLGKLCDS